VIEVDSRVGEFTEFTIRLARWETRCDCEHPGRRRRE
jgi:hypothetical protein